MNVGIGIEATQFHFWEYRIGYLVQCALFQPIVVYNLFCLKE
jgi:hypothetical protein